MSPSRYTATRLYSGTDAGFRLKLRVVTPAWLCVGAALVLSVIGILAIGTTRPELAARQSIFLMVGLAASAMVALVPPRVLRARCIRSAMLRMFVAGAVISTTGASPTWQTDAKSVVR